MFLLNISGGNLHKVKSKHKQILKSQRTKKSQKSFINSKKDVSKLKTLTFDESSSELSDRLIVEVYLSIVETRNIPQISNNSKQTIIKRNVLCNFRN